MLAAPRVRSLAPALALLACGALLAGCEDDPDVVATLEALGDGSIADLDPTDEKPMNAPDGGDSCDVDGVLYTLATVAIDCRVQPGSFILTTITTLVLGPEAPAAGGSEAREPEACDFTLAVFYPDANDPQMYTLCPRYCEALRTHIQNNGPPPECLEPQQ